VLGNFESAGSIDNDPNVSALDAWKSTGKPPAIYSHLEQLTSVVYEDICGPEGRRRAASATWRTESSRSGTTTTAKPRVATSWVAPSVTVAMASSRRPSGFVDDDGNPNTKNPHGFYGNSQPFAVG
jgi:hypothetical protein